MKVSHIGSKCFPADVCPGGIETHVEALASGLADRGHEITVYVRRTPEQPRRIGKRSVEVRGGWAPSHKWLDPALHSLVFSLEAFRRRPDIVHYHGLGPAAFAWIPKLAGCRVVTTLHGLDWKRRKWGPLGRGILRLSESLAARLCDAVIVVSRDLEQYWGRRHGAGAVYLPNAPNGTRHREPREIEVQFGLHTQGFVLFLGRLVPEKRIEWLIESFLSLPNLRAPETANLKLVIAGGSDYTERYVRRLKELSRNGPVLFTGDVSGRLRDELLSHARLFVLPSSIEGMPMALLEAMARGTPCLASDLPVHRQILTHGHTGWLFDAADRRALDTELERRLNDPRRREVGKRGRDRVTTEFRWPDIVRRTEQLYMSFDRSPGPGTRVAAR